MMGLTDRLEPWARRFQRAGEADAEREAPRASLRAIGDNEIQAPDRGTGRFARTRVLHEQEG